MEYLLGGVLFALFIAAQALALVAMRPVLLPTSRQSNSQPVALSTRGRRLLQP
jgi:hypothetical protein